MADPPQVEAAPSSESPPAVEAAAPAPLPAPEAAEAGTAPVNGADAATALAEAPVEAAAADQSPTDAPAAATEPSMGSEHLSDQPPSTTGTQDSYMDGEVSDPGVAVFFQMPSVGQEFEMVLPESTSVALALRSLGRELNLSTRKVRLRHGGRFLGPDETLRGCGLMAGEAAHRVEVVFGDQEDYVMPSVIDVVVQFDSGESTTMQVAVERASARKPYLGGYRHKKTALEYHHASSQTEPEPRDFGDSTERFHRETQTYETKSRSQQTTRESGTQMERRDLYVDTEHDRDVHPRQYFDSAQLDVLRQCKTIVIQCYWRGYVARKRAWFMREELFKRQQRAEDAERLAQSEAESRHKREIERRMHPRTFEDFEILYNELENWRQHETMRINSSGLEERERLTALAQLLHKETKLLQTIDRLKVTANVENRDRRIKTMLGLMSAPKLWQLADGEVAEVHTPFTTRAKELLELYNGLNLPLLTMDERLDVLLHVKWTVKEFDCALTRSIVDLIDREADLLNRGRSEKSMAGLRKRIASLFLQFIEEPEFNPEAARFQKVPKDFLTASTSASGVAPPSPPSEFAESDAMLIGEATMSSQQDPQGFSPTQGEEEGEAVPES